MKAEVSFMGSSHEYLGLVEAEDLKQAVEATRKKLEQNHNKLNGRRFCITAVPPGEFLVEIQE